MVKLLKRNPWIGYAITACVMMGVMAVIFIKDINPLRKPVNHETVVQSSENIVKQTEDTAEAHDRLEGMRDLVQLFNKALKNLEKEHIMQTIPELSELGKQFEKTINSWGTRTTSVGNEQSTGAK